MLIILHGTGWHIDDRTSTVQVTYRSVWIIAYTDDIIVTMVAEQTECICQSVYSVYPRESIARSYCKGTAVPMKICYAFVHQITMQNYVCIM